MAALCVNLYTLFLSEHFHVIIFSIKDPARPNKEHFYLLVVFYISVNFHWLLLKLNFAIFSITWMVDLSLTPWPYHLEPSEPWDRRTSYKSYFLFIWIGNCIRVDSTWSQPRVLSRQKGAIASPPAKLRVLSRSHWISFAAVVS